MPELVVTAVRRRSFSKCNYFINYNITLSTTTTTCKQRGWRTENNIEFLRININSCIKMCVDYLCLVFVVEIHDVYGIV